MPISVPPRGLPGSLQNRQARPLTGIEVKDAITRHLMVLTDKMLGSMGLLSDEVISLTESFSSFVKEELSRQPVLQKINITYPGVGWSIKVRLEQLEDGSQFVNGEMELDLSRNLRIPLRFGHTMGGNVLKSLEEEKIPNNVPDRDRQSFGLKVEAEFVTPEGTVQKIDLNELKERKAARTVDVGSGAPDRVPKELPVQKMEDDGTVIVGTEEVLMVGGQQGEDIVLANRGPEITLEVSDDDLLGSPPPGPKEPPKIPLPPKGSMSQVHRPGVKFKK